MATGSDVGFRVGNTRPPTKCNCQCQLHLQIRSRLDLQFQRYCHFKML